MQYAIWLDFIERDFLHNDFGRLIETGTVCGATSNPAIFASAMTSSAAYGEQLASLQGASPKAIYEALAIDDIRTAARLLRPVYDKGEGDGYVSIEVDPFLAHDTQGTIQEGKRLFEAIGEPNVMIKVPATKAGYGAMEALLSEGISVNATLVFAPEQAERCTDAMMRGMDKSDADTHAVVSVFVSRFDRKLDGILRERGLETGKTGIYNAAIIYHAIEALRRPRIRTLFASTGVKGDDLPPAYYVASLACDHAVNTAPLATIEAYGKAEAIPSMMPIPQSKIDDYFTHLAQVGIAIDEVRSQLLHEGLKAFEEAFEDLLGRLAA